MIKVFAIIPARGGSKGVPRKNVKPLAGYPLMAYSIAAARMSSRIDRIVVSTDSEEIADIARKFGAETPFLRPTELAGDLAPDRDFVLHALKWFHETEGNMPDYLVHLRPTTPLRDSTVVDRAIETILEKPDATSLRSGHAAPESPFKWFMRDNDGYFHGFAHAETEPGYSNLPRQMFPTVYIPNGYVDVLKTSFVLNSPDIHGNRMIGYVTPLCCEVDTLDDFDYLEFQIGRSNTKLLDFMRTNYPG